MIIIRDRVCRIVFEKPAGAAPAILTVHEDIIDGVSTLVGNMLATYDENNPLDVALYAALEAKIDSMRVVRDAVSI